MDIKEWLKHAFAVSQPPDNSFTLRDIMDTCKIGERQARKLIQKKLSDSEIKEIKCVQNGAVKKYYIVAEPYKEDKKKTSTKKR